MDKEKGEWTRRMKKGWGVGRMDEEEGKWMRRRNNE